MVSKTINACSSYRKHNSKHNSKHNHHNSNQNRFYTCLNGPNVLRMNKHKHTASDVSILSRIMQTNKFKKTVIRYREYPLCILILLFITGMSIMVFGFTMCGGKNIVTHSPESSKPADDPSEHPSAVESQTSVNQPILTRKTQANQTDGSVFSYEAGLEHAAGQLFEPNDYLAQSEDSDPLRIGIGSFSDLEQSIHPLNSLIASLFPVYLATYAPESSNIYTRNKIQDCLEELQLQQSDFFDADSQQQIGALLGANTLIVGEIIDAASYYQIVFHVLDVETAEEHDSTSIKIANDEALQSILGIDSDSPESSDITPADETDSMLGRDGDYYTEVITGNPEVNILMQKAVFLEEHHKFGRALELYKQLAELTEPTAKLLHKLGWMTALVEHNLPQAMEYLNQAIEIAPTDAPPYNARGMIYRQQEDYEKALADFNKAIELRPEFAEAYLNRASIHQALQNREQAFSDLDQALAINSNLDMVYVERAKMFSSHNDWEMALQSINVAIRMNPDKVMNFYHRGRILKEMGRCEQAIRDFERCSERRLSQEKAQELRQLIRECRQHMASSSPRRDRQPILPNRRN